MTTSHERKEDIAKQLKRVREKLDEADKLLANSMKVDKASEGGPPDCDDELDTKNALGDLVVDAQVAHGQSCFDYDECLQG